MRKWLVNAFHVTNVVLPPRAPSKHLKHLKHTSSTVRLPHTLSLLLASSHNAKARILGKPGVGCDGQDGGGTSGVEGERVRDPSVAKAGREVRWDGDGRDWMDWDIGSA